MVGTTVSHYQILEKLSEGGMGVVQRARVTALGLAPPPRLRGERVQAG